MLGFDFCEAGGAGFGLRDFAADIVGGAGVQRPDGGFVQDVVGTFVPTDHWGVRFGERAFGPVADVGGFGFLACFFLLVVVIFFDFFVFRLFRLLAGGGDVVGVGADLLHEELEVVLTFLVVLVFVKQGGADFGAGGPGFEFLDEFIVGFLPFAFLFGGEDGVFLGNEVAAAILDEGLVDAENGVEL